MEKVISSPEQVHDLYGLFADLKKQSFAVINVGADMRGTYVYLDEDEEKDPLPVVETWVGKPAPDPSKELHAQRTGEMKELAAPPAEKELPFLMRLWKKIF
jgi:hypothetical protein